MRFVRWWSWSLVGALLAALGCAGCGGGASGSRGLPNTRLYAVNYAGNTLSIVAVGTRTVTDTIPVGAAPISLLLSADGTRVYTANWGDNSVSVVDTATKTVVGTVAMFLVGGGILGHGIAPLHHAVEGWVAGAGPVVGTLLPLLADGVVGLLAGALVLAVVTGVQRLRKSRSA